MVSEYRSKSLTGRHKARWLYLDAQTRRLRRQDTDRRRTHLNLGRRSGRERRPSHRSGTDEPDPVGDGSNAGRLYGARSAGGVVEAPTRHLCTAQVTSSGLTKSELSGARWCPAHRSVSGVSAEVPPVQRNADGTQSKTGASASATTHSAASRSVGGRKIVALSLCVPGDSMTSAPCPAGGDGFVVDAASGITLPPRPPRAPAPAHPLRLPRSPTCLAPT